MSKHTFILLGVFHPANLSILTGKCFSTAPKTGFAHFRQKDWHKTSTVTLFSILTFFQLWSAPPISKRSSTSSTSSMIRGSPCGWPSRKSSSPSLMSSFSTLLGFLSSAYSRIWRECKKRTDLNLLMFNHSLKVWSSSKMLRTLLIFNYFQAILILQLFFSTFPPIFPKFLAQCLVRS